MKCLQVKDGVDLCVTVNVKLIYTGNEKKTDDIRLELIRNDAKRVAQHLGSRKEADLAVEIKEGLEPVELGI